MKDLVRLPSVFLLAFILLFLLLLSLSLLATWGQLLPAQRQLRGQSLETAAARLPSLAREVLPASVLAALLVVSMRVARRPGSRLLSLILPPACAFLLLVFGYQALGGLDSVWGKRAPPDSRSAAAYLAPGVFNRAGARVVYVQSLEGQRATGVVLLGEGEVPARLLYTPRGEVAVRAGTAALRLGSTVLEWPARGVHDWMFAGDPMLRPFLEDAQSLDRELARQYIEARGTFYLSSLGLVLALCGAAVLLRLTRWPLLNACLTLLAARGVLALFVLLRQDGATALGKALGGGPVSQSLPAAGLLLLGALMVLLDLLFVPFRREPEASDRA